MSGLSHNLIPLFVTKTAGTMRRGSAPRSCEHYSTDCRVSFTIVIILSVLEAEVPHASYTTVRFKCYCMIFYCAGRESLFALPPYRPHKGIEISLILFFPCELIKTVDGSASCLCALTVSPEAATRLESHPLTR